ncbi:MAG TPA: hypothetical protein VD993_04030 [Chitinophagaceae bacterium]|nr:hypothetical protein [Chitinophagaceae bacterium]
MPGTPPFHDSNDELNSHWKSIKDADFSASFPETAQWIRENAKSGRFGRNRTRSRIKWTVAAFIPLLFIISCTYKVDRLEKFGDLINFSLHKGNHTSFQQLASLQKRFGFSSYQLFQPGLPHLASFISLVRNDAGVIEKELSAVSGVSRLKVSRINYSVRESLFSTFVHTRLKMGASPKPEKEVIKKAVQNELKTQGFAHVDIDIAIDEKEPLVVKYNLPEDTESDTAVTIIYVPDSAPRFVPRSNTMSRQARQLKNFEWILGTWKVLHKDVETWHHWVGMSDTVLKCYVLEKPGKQVNLTVGFYLKNSHTNEIELHLKSEQWTFVTRSNTPWQFSNDSEGPRSDVTWALKDNNTWQIMFSGQGNKEFINLSRQPNQEMEDLVRSMIKNHPDKGTKY